MDGYWIGGLIILVVAFAYLCAYAGYCLRVWAEGRREEEAQPARLKAGFFFGGHVFPTEEEYQALVKCYMDAMPKPEWLKPGPSPCSGRGELVVGYDIGIPHSAFCVVRKLAGGQYEVITEWTKLTPAEPTPTLEDILRVVREHTRGKEPVTVKVSNHSTSDMLGFDAWFDMMKERKNMRCRVVPIPEGDAVKVEAAEPPMSFDYENGQAIKMVLHYPDGTARKVLGLGWKLRHQRMRKDGVSTIIRTRLDVTGAFDCPEGKDEPKKTT